MSYLEETSRLMSFRFDPPEPVQPYRIGKVLVRHQRDIRDFALDFSVSPLRVLAAGLDIGLKWLREQGAIPREYSQQVWDRKSGKRYNTFFPRERAKLYRCPKFLCKHSHEIRVLAANCSCSQERVIGISLDVGLKKLSDLGGIPYEYSERGWDLAGLGDGTPRGGLENGRNGYNRPTGEHV